MAAERSGIHAGKCNTSQLVMQTMNTKLQTPPTLTTAEQIAPAFQMTPPQIWRLARQGRIPVIRLGRRTLLYIGPLTPVHGFVCNVWLGAWARVTPGVLPRHA
jgi:hypothetical protein